MMGAIRAVSTQRGRDVRDFALVAFGGCGPLHAIELARAVGMRRVIVPENPGLFSAFGLLTTELAFQSSRVLYADLDALPIARLKATLAELQAEVARIAAGELGGAGALAFDVELECRYWGQTYELAVALPYCTLETSDKAMLREHFESEHERTYGHRGSNEQVTLVAARVHARAQPPASIATARPRAASAEPGPPRTREAYFGPERGRIATPVIARAELATTPRSGPLLIEEYDSVIVVPPGCGAHLARSGAVIIDVATEGR
jgi:N-methylhydantoinase A